jgi:heme/copper-type cytochrome/quinol oxidase subunit 2
VRLQTIPFAQRPSPSSLFGRAAFLSATALFLAPFSPAITFNAGQIPSIFKPESTPTDAIRTISRFTLIITSLIFAVVTRLLVYVIAKFRRTTMRDDYEPPQVYGSNRVELAWTVIPVLIVLVLFLASSRSYTRSRMRQKLRELCESLQWAISLGGSIAILRWDSPRRTSSMRL